MASEARTELLTASYKNRVKQFGPDMAMGWVNPWVGLGWVRLGQKFLDFGGLGWVRNPYRSLATKFVRSEESILHTQSPQ
jgi:hypothetical protein